MMVRKLGWKPFNIEAKYSAISRVGVAVAARPLLLTVRLSGSKFFLIISPRTPPANILISKRFPCKSSKFRLQPNTIGLKVSNYFQFLRQFAAFPNEFF